MSIKNLENKANLQILLFLRKHGKTKVTDIKIDASSGTLYRALNTLADLELIEEERVRPFTRFIQLTREGGLAAEALKEIDDILEAKKVRLKRQAQP
jgi:DNA-binding transcriptional ArsR family regulator